MSIMKTSESWIILWTTINLLTITVSCQTVQGDKNETQGLDLRALTPELQAALDVFQNLVGGQKPVQLLENLAGVQKPVVPGLAGSLTDLKIDIINALSKFKLNPFNFFNAFIKAWRNSFPILAPLGNYTLLQLALILTIGGLAAGAAVVVGEAFYFKTLHEEEVLHHHLRRNYDLFYRKTFLGETPPEVKTLRKKVGTLPPKRYKPQSLRRTQRRNQRKNKNAGAQLDYYKKLKANEQRRRGKRQVTFQSPYNPQFPTVAPRPVANWIRSPRPPPPFYARKPPRKPESQNMFSFQFISNFLRRHGSNFMKYMPSIPFFGNIASSTTPKYSQGQYLEDYQRKQYWQQQSA